MTSYFYWLAPELVVALGAAVVLMLGLLRNREVADASPWAALVTLLAAAAVLLLQVGRSDADIHLVGVHLTSLAWYVRLITIGVGLLILLVNLHLPEADVRAEYAAMVLASVLGLMLVALADDLVVFFLALELVSVPTYVLVAAGSPDVRAQEAGVKYFFLGALAAAILVYGFSFLYGASGTMVLSDMTGNLHWSNPYVMIGILLAFGGLTYKLAAVPFYSYAPDVYQGAASPVTGLLGFLPKCAGFVALIKLLTLIVPVPIDAAPNVWLAPDTLFWLIWIVAALTMTIGNCLALMQTNVKRILAYSSVAHSGYMLIGILVGPTAAGDPLRDGWSAVLFYIAAYGVMNLGAFAVLAYLRVHNKPVEEIDDIAGLAQVHPTAAIAMALCLFSLMGMPPTVGFFGKVFIFSGALAVSAEHPHAYEMKVLAVIGVLNAAVAAAYYLRVIGACYLREPREYMAKVPDRALRLGMALCMVFVIMVGIWPRELVRRASDATEHIRLPLLSLTRSFNASNDRGPSAPPRANDDENDPHRS
jgi:NADH-quinone oxidoreductase subunit N